MVMFALIAWLLAFCSAVRLMESMLSFVSFESHAERLRLTGLYVIAIQNLAR